jgi:hypothetical protein
VADGHTAYTTEAVVPPRDASIAASGNYEAGNCNECGDRPVMHSAICAVMKGAFVRHCNGAVRQTDPKQTELSAHGGDFGLKATLCEHCSIGWVADAEPSTLIPSPDALSVTECHKNRLRRDESVLERKWAAILDEGDIHPGRLRRFVSRRRPVEQAVTWSRQHSLLHGKSTRDLQSGL